MRMSGIELIDGAGHWIQQEQLDGPGESFVALGENQYYWVFLEKVWDAVSIYNGPDAFLHQFAQLPQAAGDLYAAHWLVSEIINGAFPQFFSNSTGVLAPEAVAALGRMGLTPAAECAEAAMSFFGEQYPRDRGIRSEMIDWVWETEMTEDQEADLATLLGISGDFLDAVGNDGARFVQAANEYAANHLASV